MPSDVRKASELNGADRREKAGAYKRGERTQRRRGQKVKREGRTEPDHAEQRKLKPPVFSVVTLFFSKGFRRDGDGIRKA